MNEMYVLNGLVLAGIVISAFCAATFRNVLSSVIALGITGAFMALEFLLLQAPDVAIAEASVGAVLTTAIFIVAIFRTVDKEDEGK